MDGKNLSYLELRALIDIDWWDNAPPAAETSAWVEYWAHLEDFVGLEISDDVLQAYNATLSKDSSLRSLDDVRMFVRSQLRVVERWIEQAALT